MSGLRIWHPPLVHAWQIDAFGDYRNLELREVEPDPLPNGHVRITVEASGMNFPDMLMVAGRYDIRPQLPVTPGSECAGVVVEVADDVETLAVGDRVLAGVWCGGYATELVAPALRVFPLPAGMPAEHAAGFYSSYLTAGAALLMRAELRSGESLVVTGAAGALGSATVQLGRALGARVIAVVGTDAKGAFATENGADEVVIRGEDDLRLALRALAPSGVDVALDVVGGAGFEDLARAMAWNGRLLVLGFAGGTIQTLRTNLVLLKGSAVVGVNAGLAVERDRAGYWEMYRRVMDLYDCDTLRPQVVVIPFEQAVAGLDAIRERRAFGKYVLNTAGFSEQRLGDRFRAMLKVGQTDGSSRLTDNPDFEELLRQLRHAADEGNEGAREVLRRMGEYGDGRDTSEESREGVLQVLTDAVYQFEADHPRLTAAIQKVVDSLTAGGL